MRKIKLKWNILSKYSQFFEKNFNSWERKRKKNSSHLGFDFSFLAFFLKN